MILALTINVYGFFINEEQAKRFLIFKKKLGMKQMILKLFNIIRLNVKLLISDAHKKY